MFQIHDNLVTIVDKGSSDKTFDDMVQRLESLGERECAYMVYDQCVPARRASQGSGS